MGENAESARKVLSALLVKYAEGVLTPQGVAAA